MAAENCDIEEGDTVAVWGCGPVGLFAIQSALIMGAQQVIAIDHYPHRLELAKRLGAKVINFKDVHVHEALLEMTGGIGPDAVIDAVGMESHGFALDSIYDGVKQALMLATDRPHALRDALRACRKGAGYPSPAYMAVSSTSSRSAP